MFRNASQCKKSLRLVIAKRRLCGKFEVWVLLRRPHLATRSTAPVTGATGFNVCLDFHGFSFNGQIWNYS